VLKPSGRNGNTINDLRLYKSTTYNSNHDTVSRALPSVTQSHVGQHGNTNWMPCTSCKYVWWSRPLMLTNIMHKPAGQFSPARVAILSGPCQNWPANKGARRTASAITCILP
jgi:hypothetical protein